MADDFDIDAQIDAAIDAEIEKQLGGNDEEKLRRVHKASAKGAYVPRDSIRDKLEAGWSGVKSGIGGMFGGRENISGSVSAMKGSFDKAPQEAALSVGAGLLSTAAPIALGPLGLPLMPAAFHESQKAVNPTDFEMGADLQEQIKGRETEGNEDIAYASEVIAPLMTARLGQAPRLPAAPRVGGSQGGASVGADIIGPPKPPTPGLMDSIVEQGGKEASGFLPRMLASGIKHFRQPKPLAAQEIQPIMPSRMPSGGQPKPPSLPPPPKPPDSNVFQFSPPKEIPLGPAAEGPVFRSNSPYSPPPDLPPQGQRLMDIEAMAAELEALIAKRGMNVASPQERAKAQALAALERKAMKAKNLGQDPNASMANAPTVAMKPSGPSGTQISPPKPPTQLTAPSPMSNVVEPPPPPSNVSSGGPSRPNPQDDMVPQWVRDRQTPDAMNKPMTDRQMADLEWLQSQFNGNRGEVAEQMLRDFYGDGYVDVLIKNLGQL